MTEEGKIYRALQKHLNKQPVGYPATRSGSDIRVLKRLFTPAEARLATHLDYRPRSLGDIHEDLKDTGMSPDSLGHALDAMAAKASIGRVERGGTPHYFTLPLVVGMYEGQLYELDREFLRDFEEYTASAAFGLEFLASEIPQLRTIPVERSITVQRQVATYDRLTTLIHESNGPFVVNECICRKAADLKGSPCRITSRLETCMALGDVATRCIRAGKGREVSRQEALWICRRNQDEGLVLQPSNSQKADFICACCGCCCGMLRLHKALPRPLEFWASNYRAVVEPEACTGCGACVETCQVGAVKVKGQSHGATVDPRRCLGCGNCVSACQADAMRLVKKDREFTPPETWEDLSEAILRRKKGFVGKMGLAGRLMLQGIGAKRQAKPSRS